MSCRAMSVLGLFLAVGAVADDGPLQAGGVAHDLPAREPVLIQAGRNQLLLAVTDDDFAVYQEGQKLYASALRQRARRREIAEIPNGNLAQVLQVGDVVMAWIDPQRNVPGFGVSPLVIWSAHGGAHRISENSAVGLVAADASRDSFHVLFTTNATPDGGSAGDLAMTDVFAAQRPKILLKGIQLGFPSAPCRPLAAFIGPPGQAVPTAEYCVPGETTATLSRWVRGRKVDLLKNIATPLPFVLETNPQETEFFVRLAGSGAPAVVSDSGRMRVIEHVAGTAGFVTARGAAVYSARTAPGAPLELRLAGRRAAPVTVATPFLFAHASLHDFAGYAKLPTPSPDGRLVLFSSAVDPATGLIDVQLLDLHRGAVVTVDSRLQSSTSPEVFTSDSRYALYLSDFNAVTGTFALYAADQRGVARQVSADNLVLLNRAAAGSIVSFNDHPVLNSAPLNSFGSSTADLRVADVARPNAGPRLIAAQANIFYFTSHQRRGLVYTTDTAAAPGLYLAAARP